MKKVVTLGLLIVVVLSLVGLAPVRVSASQAATNNLSLADLMPANTAMYADVRTANFDATVNTLLDLFRKAGVALPASVYTDIDKSLTQLLGRPATFKGDVLSWLGDHIAVGVSVTDDMLSNPTSNAMSQPPTLAILSVKDETAADAFLKDTLAAIQKQGLQFQSSTDTIGGIPATVYTNTLVNIDIVRFKGYVVIGTAPAVTAMADTLNTKKPTLGADAGFQKTMALLKPDNGLTVFVGGRLFAEIAASAQASAALMQKLATPGAATPDVATPDVNAQMQMLTQIYKGINGVALAARSDGKVLALDVATSLDPSVYKTAAAALGLSDTTMLQQVGPALTGQLAAQIPSTAGAVIFGANLASFYKTLRTEIPAITKLQANMSRTPGLNFDQADQSFTQLEQGLNDAFNLDMNQDILSWMGGEFAVYMNYDKTGDLAVASNNAFPYDSTLLIATTDTAKAKAFVDKLNNGLKGAAGITPTSMGTDLYSVSGGASPVRLGYGVAKNTFIFSTGSGVKPAADAVQGTDTLASGSNAVWKRATATLPNRYQSFFYLDLTQISTYLGAAMKAQGPSMNNPQATQGLAFLGEFESAVIYSSTMSDGTGSVGSLELLLK